MPNARSGSPDGVPLYTFDRHTAIGRTAIRRLARESQPVRDALRSAPSPRVREIASIAAFYADGAPVARRLKWEGAAALEALGVEAEMLRAGAPTDSIAPYLLPFATISGIST